MSSYVYQVVAKGNTLTELRQSLEDCLADLTNGRTVSGITKNLEVLDGGSTSTDELEEVPSPFAPVRMGEEDIEGVPWNSKYHASSKEKNKDGTWRNRRGVDKAEVEAYRASFRANTSAAPTAVTSPAPQPQYAAPALPQTSTPSAPVATPATPAVVVAPPLPTMSVNKGHTLESFKAGFPVILSSLLTEGKIDQNYVNDLKNFFKVGEIWNINDEQKLAVFNQWTSPEWNLIQKVG